MGLNTAKTRVDQALLHAGVGIHPLPPGVLARCRTRGTHGAPGTMPDVKLSCVAFRDETGHPVSPTDNTVSATLADP